MGLGSRMLGMFTSGGSGQSGLMVGGGLGTETGVGDRDDRESNTNEQTKPQDLEVEWRNDGGEFDPGSGSTLAACLMHASRTGCLRVLTWRTGEEHVGNLSRGGG